MVSMTAVVVVIVDGQDGIGRRYSWGFEESIFTSRPC